MASSATEHGAVAVTGATGFVGGALVDFLAAAGVPVVALSRTPPAGPGNNLGVEWRKMPPLGPTSDYRGLFDGVGCVIHCAARVHVMSDPAADPLTEFRRVNRDGTLALAEAAASAGVERFVFVSSIKVNGERTVPGAPFGPEDLPRPVDPYGISKWEAETGLQAIAGRTGMELAVIRPVLVYGPGVRANFAAIARLAASGMPLPLGAADNRRSLVFVGNLVDLLARMAVRPLPARRLLLVSDGEAISTGELVRALAQAQGRRARLIPVPASIMRGIARIAGRAAIAERLFGSLETDTAHLSEIGWQPPFTLAQGLQRTFGGDRS